MPRDTEQGSPESESLLGNAEESVKRFWDGFIDFIFDGNVLKVAIGLVVASIFTDLVKSFVSDILLPPISVILPINKNIEEKFAVLRAGQTFNASEGYNTLQQAQEDGAVVMAYGSFLYQVISFFMIGLAIYLIGLGYATLSHKSVIKRQKKCRYCRVKINAKALRCVNCTSWVDGREERISYDETAPHTHLLSPRPGR